MPPTKSGNERTRHPVARIEEDVRERERVAGSSLHRAEERVGTCESGAALVAGWRRLGGGGAPATKDARQARARRNGLVRHEPLGAPTPRAEHRAVCVGSDGGQVGSDVRREDDAPARGVDGAEATCIGTRSDNEHRRRRAELRHLATLLVEGAAQLFGQCALRGTRRLPRLSLRRDGAEWEAATQRVVLTRDGLDDRLWHARGGEGARISALAEAWRARPARASSGRLGLSAKRAACRARR